MRGRGRPAWVVLVIAGCVGSAFGLAFGVGALNRPLLNGLTFYVVGFAVGVAVAAAVVAVRRARGRARAGSGR